MYLTFIHNMRISLGLSETLFSIVVLLHYNWLLLFPLDKARFNTRGREINLGFFQNLRAMLPRLDSAS